MFCSSSEKMVVTFTILGNFAVTTRVSLTISLSRDKVFNLRWDPKTTLKLQKRTVLLTLLTKRDLNCTYFLPRNGRTRVNCFLGANKCTSFLTYKLSRDFLLQKSVNLTVWQIFLKMFFKFSTSWWNSLKNRT